MIDRDISRGEGCFFMFRHISRLARLMRGIIFILVGMKRPFGESVNVQVLTLTCYLIG